MLRNWYLSCIQIKLQCSFDLKNATETKTWAIYKITLPPKHHGYIMENDYLENRLLLLKVLLVFSKCFHAGYFTFSQLKFKVNKGINLLNLCFKIKTKTYLVFISVVTIHSACHC